MTSSLPLPSPGPEGARHARFTALYRAHHDFVWRALRRLGVAEAATVDAAQEVWIIAFRHLDQLREVATARPWLFMIVRRVAWRQRRTRARADRKLAALAHDPGRASPPVDAAADPERGLDAAVQIERYLARLPGEQRRVFILAELLSMTAREIAATLAIKPATVYSRLRLARGRLDELLATERAESRERLVAAVSRRDAPDPGQGRRTWALLAPGLGAAEVVPTAPAAGLVAGALGGEGLLGGWALVGVIVGLIAVSVGAPRRPPAADVSEPPHARAPASAPHPAPRGAPPPTPPEDPVDLAAETTTPAAARGGDEEAARGGDEEAARGRRPGATRRPPARGDAAALERETAILVSAREALLGGHPERALAELDRHAADFPAGELREVREATRVQALCDLGRPEDAAASARALAAVNPERTIARTLGACRASAAGRR